MNYHDRGVSDILVAEHLMSPSGNPTHDEGIYDIAAYHVQQGIEKELKYVLHDLNGVDDSSRAFKTHNIADLIGQVEGIGFSIPTALKEIAYDLTDWEAASRYGQDMVSTVEEIQCAINIYHTLVETVNRSSQASSI